MENPAKALFSADYYRMIGETYAVSLSSIKNMLFNHNLRFMRLWRKASVRKTPFRQLQLYRYSRKYGLEISCDAQIGPGLYLGHPYNITVSSGTVMGRNVNLHKGATVGMESRGSRRGSPTIGDQVWIGGNATVVGKITIGSDVLIAPGAFVNFDVPDHSIVLGNPGRIIPKEQATWSYVNFLV